jgi:peptide/nickel transport system permease protein
MSFLGRATGEELAFEAATTEPVATRGWRAFFVELARSKVGLVGLVLVLFLVVVAIAAPLIAPSNPLTSHPAALLEAPSRAHWFGTDDQGRDILSRVIYGTRISLTGAIGIVAIGILVGTPIGLVAGYFGGWLDEILMRITDMFLAFPALILAMAVAATLGPSLLNAVLAIGVTWWPWYARLVRGQTLRLRHQPFVEAARVSGGGGVFIIRRHILRNVLSPIIVQASLDIGYAILTLAGLSFIGLGAQPPTPEWGSMISVGRDYYLVQWWFVTFPGLAIVFAVLAFTLFGDGLQRAMPSARGMA